LGGKKESQETIRERDKYHLLKWDESITKSLKKDVTYKGVA